MPTLDTVDLNYLFSMFKGEPGTRKSTAALSYPLPQYWISTDQKMEALKLPALRWGINMKEVHYDDYTDWTKADSKLEQLKVNCPYKTIIVDSVTSMGDAMTAETRKLKAGGGKKIGNVEVSGFEEYNAEASSFQKLIASLKDIHKYHKVHIIMIAHVVGQRKSDDGNSHTHHSRVIITGGDKIAGKIASYMTEAYHFNVKASFDADAGKGQYGLYTTHTGNDYARTSLPLDRNILFNDDPLYEKWILPAIKKQMESGPIIGTNAVLIPSESKFVTKSV